MNFFAPEDLINYPACGMFSTTHIIVTTLCIIAIGVLFYFTRKITDETLTKITKIAAIVITILEAIKIGYNFYYGYTDLNSWLPLSFCSIFIYTLWISGFSKGNLKKYANAYIVGGGIVCGFSFLVMPTTSITLHPMFHYLCCYSMLYHSTMVYLGIMYLHKKRFVPSVKNYKYYFLYSGVFLFTALIVNFSFDVNMMFINKPFNLPFDFINKIGENLPALYIILAVCVYLLCPYFFVTLSMKVIEKLSKNPNEKPQND